MKLWGTKCFVTTKKSPIKMNTNGDSSKSTVENITKLYKTHSSITSIKQNFAPSNSYGIEPANMAQIHRTIRDLNPQKATRFDKI